LLDRGYGRAPQAIVGENGQSITLLHLVAVREAGEKVVAELIQRRTTTLIDGNETAVIEVPDLSTPAPE
jgi:hypothetical protein